MEEKNKELSEERASTQVEANEEKKERARNVRLSFLLMRTGVTVLVFCLVVIIMLMIKNSLGEMKWGGQTVVPKNLAAGAPRQFGSYEELWKFLEKSAGDAGREGLMGEVRGIGGADGVGNTPLSSAEWGEVAGNTAPQAVPREEVKTLDHSQTNVQIAGVDEADMVKNDGKHIYYIQGNKVLILSALPADHPQLTTQIEMDFNPEGLYVDGDRLVVYGENFSVRALSDAAKLEQSRRESQNFVVFKVYDISRREAPKEIKNYVFEGTHRASRLIDGRVYVVSAAYPQMEIYTKERPLPYVFEDGKVVPLSARPQVFYFDGNYANPNFTTVSSFNLRDLEKTLNSETFVTEGAESPVLVSRGNLYLTFVERRDESEVTLEVVMKNLQDKLNEEERAQVTQIQKAEDYILSPQEKRYKLLAIYTRVAARLPLEEKDALAARIEKETLQTLQEKFSEMQTTKIYRLEIAQGKLNFIASGAVSGAPLNQFSLDESATGSLRIATTLGNAWETREGLKSYSNVYVLDKNLKRIGAVEKLATGERIYAARFMQERAYLVTFKQTDPLFVLDLKDEKNPRVLGELKLPGFSTYLHPYGENFLIGLGQDAEAETGRTTGKIKLSLFDVSKVNEPRELSSYVSEGTAQSAAVNNHVAFNFWPDKNLLVIPMSVSRGAGVVSSTDFGVAVFRVDEQKIEWRKLISHRGDGAPVQFDRGFSSRALYIGDNLYSLSNNFLKVNALGDLKEVSSLKLPPLSETPGGPIMPMEEISPARVVPLDGE